MTKADEGLPVRSGTGPPNSPKRKRDSFIIVGSHSQTVPNQWNFHLTPPDRPWDPESSPGAHQVPVCLTHRTNANANAKAVCSENMVWCIDQTIV